MGVTSIIRSTLVRVAYKAIATGVRIPNSRMAESFDQWSRLIGLIRRLDVNVFLDVGANRGFFSKHLRMSGYRGHLVSFDPILEHHDQIKTLAAGDPRWRTCCYALGSENTNKDFHLNLRADTLSSFLSLKDQSHPARTIRVEMRRLDAVLSQLIDGIKSPRIFLKMDTQGFDDKVLDGASGCVDQIVGLQSEISVIPLYDGMTHYTDSLALYERLGFELVDLFVVNRRNGFILEFDAVMARPGALIGAAPFAGQNKISSTLVDTR